MRVVLGSSPALAFEGPQRVIRAATPHELARAFDDVERALRDGAWAAGYLAYDRGIDGDGDLAAIGLFEQPVTMELPPAATVEHAPLLPLVERKRYEDGVRVLQRAIYDGDVYQVNFTVPFAFASRTDPFTLYTHFAARTGAGYQAFVEDGARAILSWSPELFLEFDGARVRTKPMKGTAPLDRIDDLQNPKNRAEHVMIVDLLRNDLQRACDDVEVEAFCTIERYPTFATMTSTIGGTPRAGTSLGDLFSAAFPCGSITGAPKRAAMNFISRYETAPRGAYCGSVGFLSPQRRGWWNVAIRTAQLDRETGAGRFDAGGGIVADSTPRDEWDEIALKSRFLEPAEGFAILETFAADAARAVIDVHLHRMRETARRFGIDDDAVAWNGGGPRRLVRLRLAHDGTLSVTDEPLAALAEPVRVCLASTAVRSDDPYLRCKTSWRPAHDRAAAVAADRGCFDALLHNERGEITEGWRTNVFYEMDAALWTPPLESGVLPGILRARLVSEGQARERPVTAAELRRAGAIYVGNSARGLMRAVLLED